MHLDTAFVFDHHEPLSKLVFGLLQRIPQHFDIVSLVLSALLCFVQSLLINNIVNENKVLTKKNYLAGLLFIIVFSFFKESLVLSPASISLTFLILCTKNIFELIKKEKAFGDVYDVGMLAAIATLFYFPSILFLVFAYAALGAVRSFSYKEWVIVLFGFLSPFILVFTWYFWTDQQALLLHDIANIHGKIWLKGLALNSANWILIGSLALLSIAALVLLPGALYSTLIQVRKYASSLVFLIFLILASFYLQQTVSLSHLSLLALPLSIIFSIVLMQIKNKRVSEVIHLILILLVLAGQYLPLFNLI
jgi:hypothetical protein